MKIWWDEGRANEEYEVINEEDVDGMGEATLDKDNVAEEDDLVVDEDD